MAAAHVTCCKGDAFERLVSQRMAGPGVRQPGRPLDASTCCRTNWDLVTGRTREGMTMRHQSDVSAYSEFVTLRSASLFRTAYLVIGDYQLAQDLLQESLIRLCRAWPRLRDEGNAEAYTRRIIVTTSISWRRRRSFHERPATVLPEGVG